jgi:hypothetical protein
VRFARFEPELQIAPGLAMPRSALPWYSFLLRTMRAVEPPLPPQAPSEPSLEPRASPPSRRATASGVDLAPKIPLHWRQRWGRGKTAFFPWEWRVGARRLIQIRAHRSIWGPNRFNSRIPVLIRDALSPPSVELHSVSLSLKKPGFWSVGPKCGNYFHAAWSAMGRGRNAASIPVCYPCAIQSRLQRWLHRRLSGGRR